MATQVQFRGGTTTEHSSFNGVAREVTVDTTKKTLVVQDGSTNGGFPLLRQDLDNLPAGTIATADIADLGVTTGKIADLGVTTGKIAADAVTEAKIANDAVGAEHIEDLDGDVKWLDTKRAVFGTDNDCKIHFNGTKTWIDVFTGDFGIAVSNASDHSADFIAGGGVKLYWDGGNNPKFETTSAGGTLTGHLTVTGEVIGSDDINIPVDNKKLNLGASADLKLYHNGSNYIHYANGNLVFKNGTEADANCTQFDSNGDMYFPDDAMAYFGGSADLKIYHNATNTIITNSTGDLYLNNTGANSDDIIIKTIDDIKLQVNDGEEGIQVHANGGVDLYYDGGSNTTPKIQTTAAGVTIPTATDGHGLTIDAGSNDVYPQITLTANRAGENNSIGYIRGQWNDTDVAAINFVSGPDTANKDDGKILFYTRPSGGGMTQRMTIDDQGRVGLGTSTPGAWHPNANQFVISRSGSCGLSIDSTSSSESSIYFGDGTQSTEAYMGFIEYSNNNDNMSIGVLGTTCIQILSSTKDVRVHNGNLVIGTAGKGIDFSNQTWTSATGGNTDSEVLDHYEEGTWTPTLLGISGTNPSGGTFAINRATFIRVGRLVSVSAYISWNADWSGAAGVVNFGGLPYAVSGATTNDTHYGGAAIGFTSVPANLLNANQTLSLYANSGTSNIYGYTRPVGTSASVGGTLGAATWFNSNAGYVCFTMTYRAHS